MNQTPLSDLPALLGKLDARLTALEAKQAKRPMAIHLETALDEAQADIERQADEIKRLEAVCDDLSDKLDAANATPNHTDSEKLAFARNEIDWLRNTLDEAQDKIERLLAENRRLTDGFYALEAQRNTLAAQVDDLRNVNAGLRNENARLKSSVVATVNEINGDLAAENARLRTENDVLRRDYGIKRRQYDEVQASLKALQDDLR